MSRRPDPKMERRILDVACRLWSQGGPKALTMRAVAKAAGTTTPTVYERYRHREDILRALRLRLREELFVELKRTRTLRQAFLRQLEFALKHQEAYQVLFDGVGRPPSLHEPWPSFNLLRQRLTDRLGGEPRQHTRLMLAVWSLAHGAAMLIIRGGFVGALRKETMGACVDAFEEIIACAERYKQRGGHSKFAAGLVLGEEKSSRVGVEVKGRRNPPDRPKRASWKPTR